MMSFDIFGFILCLFMVALLSAFAIHDFWKQNYGIATPDNTLCYYLLIYAILGVVLSIILCVIDQSSEPFYEFFLPTFLRMCLTIGLYDFLLLCFMPLLRRRFSACACAYLWVLPNVLYITYQPAFRDGLGILFFPLKTIYIPMSIFKVIFWIWFLGFLLVLGKKIYENHIFQKELLSDAYPFEDADTLAMFLKLKYTFDKKNRIKLMVSPATNTPISVGILQKNMKVILPERFYTEEEYNWIFRHELAHLKKNDCGLKLFLGVTNAIFWFLPMNWLATVRMTEDQELSCDELVVTGHGENSRREYARLILNTAGDARGFSSCLSSTGESLRYRLAHVIHPDYHGGFRNYVLIVFCTLFIFLMFGSIEVSAIGGNINEVLFQEEQDLSHVLYLRKTINLPEDLSEDDHALAVAYEDVIFDRKAWEEYFNSVRIVKCTYKGWEGSPDCRLLFSTDDAGILDIDSIAFYEDHIEVTNTGWDTTYYWLYDDGYRELLEKAEVMDTPE